MPDLPPNFRPGAFAGVADDYVRYRLPYPHALLDDLLARAGLPPNPRLLDLGCGTGRVSLPIAGHFAEVVGVDPEPAMIAAGEREAQRLGVTHIRWSVARAEDFAAPLANFDLVTCGEAFHRLDQPRVAAKVFAWLRRSGAFVTLGMGGPGRVFDVTAAMSHRERAWRRAVAQVVRAYVGEPVKRLHGAPNPTPAEGLADQEAVLRAAGFDPVISYDFEAPHEWSLEALLGNLRSTSFLSRAALGERHAAFEAELSAALLAVDPSARYAETVSSGYTLARKPGP
jgi:ubiquinone/menaquinone biosynthesis C-methylase UbiE